MYWYKVNVEEWKDKLAPGKKYRITTRWGEEEVEYTGIGAPGNERKDPVFMSGQVRSMIPWQAIEKMDSMPW